MAVEQYANAAQDTLNGSIGSGDGTLVVNSAGEFPSSGNFRILIDSEILLVTAVSGTTFTITRGVEGTSAASHSNGATVTHVLTRDGLKALGTVLHPSDSYATLNAASLNEGVVGFPTDGMFFVRHGAAAKEWWGPDYPFTPPVDGDFAWVNQEGASVDTTYGGIHLNAPAGGTGADLRIRVKTAPSTPYTITAFLLPNIINKPFHSYGLLFRESGTGELHVFDIVAAQSASGAQNQYLVLRSGKFNSPTSFNASYQEVVMPQWLNWLQISDDGVNRICRISPNGRHWSVIHSIGRTDFLTADQVGFYAGAENSVTPNLDVSVTLLSWKQT